MHSIHKANTYSLTPSECERNGRQRERGVRARACMYLYVINEAHIIFNSLVPVEIENRYGFCVHKIHVHTTMTNCLVLFFAPTDTESRLVMRSIRFCLFFLLCCSVHVCCCCYYCCCLCCYCCFFPSGFILCSRLPVHALLYTIIAHTIIFVLPIFPLDVVCYSMSVCTLYTGVYNMCSE